MTVLEGWEQLARLGPMTLPVLIEHADRLAQSLQVRVHAGERDSARDTRDIWGPAIQDHRGYARRLHELGHTQTLSAEAAGVTVRLRGGRVANTAGESAAWTWARRRALIWTPAMQDELRRCLATYRPHAKHGLRDRIWRELDEVDGHATLGHLYVRLETMGGLTVHEARRRLAQLTR